MIRTSGLAANRALLASMVNSAGSSIGAESIPRPRTETRGSSCTVTVYGLSACHNDSHVFLLYASDVVDVNFYSVNMRISVQTV